jgi:HTH domain
MLHTLNTSNHKNKKFVIDDGRRRLASLLARDSKLTQTQLAEQLGCDQSTVSDDIRALKRLSQHFISDLAKSDLAYYYKQSIDGIEEAKSEAWDIYSKSEGLSVKESLLHLGLPLMQTLRSLSLSMTVQLCLQ